MPSLPSVSTDRRAFERYVVELRARGATLEEVVDAIIAIMGSELPLRERDRRATLVLGTVVLAAEAAEQVAQEISGRGLPLPQGLVRVVQYRHANPVSTQPAGQPRKDP